jgi:hypothetical protein
MSTWTTHAIVDGTPEEVITVVSDPDCCCRWSPIDFGLGALSMALRRIAIEVERSAVGVPA